MHKPRKWQAAALKTLKGLAPDKKHLTVNAVTGSGKTALLFEFASWLLTTNRVDAVVWTTPLSLTRTQVIKDGVAHGVELDPRATLKDPQPHDPQYHGVALTFQLAYSDDCSRALATWMRRAPTLLVVDEVHHIADSATWGVHHSRVVEAATFVINATGTLFRSDELRIAGVDYVANDDGALRAIANVSYSYRQALADNVVRPVYFRRYAGTVDAVKKHVDTGDIVARETLTFPEVIEVDGGKSAQLGPDPVHSEPLRRLRLSHAVKTDWIDTMICDIRDELRACPFDDAAALLVCSSIDEANALAVRVRNLANVTPTIVHSDTPGAQDVIDNFTPGGEGADRWLITVKMVSEGVDIPRLMFLGYASNVVAEVYLRQVFGRVIRWLEAMDGAVAKIFLPNDPLIQAVAREFEVLREAGLLDRPDVPPEPCPCCDGLPCTWPLCIRERANDEADKCRCRSKPPEHRWHGERGAATYDGETLNGAEFTQSEAQWYDYLVRQSPSLATCDRLVIYRMMRDGVFRQPTHEPPAEPEPEPLAVQDERKRGSIEACRRETTGRMVHRGQGAPGDIKRELNRAALIACGKFDPRDSSSITRHLDWWQRRRETVRNGG